MDPNVQSAEIFPLPSWLDDVPTCNEGCRKSTPCNVDETSYERKRVTTPPLPVSPKWSSKPSKRPHQSPKVSSKPKSKRKPWTAAEDERLRNAVKELGGIARRWKLIAELVETRSAGQCSQRWHKRLRPELSDVNRGTWSDDEDEKLRALVNEHKAKHGIEILGMWKGISRDMNYKRTPKQCRERWRHFLNPALNNGRWTEEENCKLMRLYDQLGRQWSKIAKRMPGRTAGRVKRQAEAQLRERVHTQLGHPSRPTYPWSTSYTQDAKSGAFERV